MSKVVSMSLMTIGELGVKLTVNNPEVRETPGYNGNVKIDPVLSLKEKEFV